VINADNDEHIWAEDYDRDLKPMFSGFKRSRKKNQRYPAGEAVANEKADSIVGRRKNFGCVFTFIQAEPYATSRICSEDDSRKRGSFTNKQASSIQTLAAAFACLSMVESWAYHTFDPTPARREKARVTADQALRLQPDLPEGQPRPRLHYYYGDRDYERALAEFEIAKRGLPNEAQSLHGDRAAIQRRQGQVDGNFDRETLKGPPHSEPQKRKLPSFKPRF